MNYSVFFKLFVLLMFHFFVGEYVAQFKFTIILMPNGPLKITSPPFENSIYQSEYSVTDEKLKVNFMLFSV